tara:strand:- start:2664 stop:2903 length:240 start_codon:yes stop_codon:yes gene_type:complete
MAGRGAPSPSKNVPKNMNATTGTLELFHKLNNQLGIILANAELMESKLDQADKNYSRVSQIVNSAIQAIKTAKDLRNIS